MSLELFEENNCPMGGNHSILVGMKCCYCMNCGQILLEFPTKKDRKAFKKLMNPIEEHSMENVKTE